MTNDSNTDRQGGRSPRVSIGATGDMSCTLDAGCVCVSANAAFLQAFGRREDEIVGSCVNDPEHREIYSGLVEDCLDKALAGESVSTQRWFDFPSLGFRYVSVSVEPVRDAADKIGRVAVCIRDHTDARLAQEALEESERRFEEFADIVSDCLWELDADLRFVYLSPRFEAIMGMPRERVLGRRRIELFPGEDQAGAATRDHHRDLEHRRPFEEYRFTRVLADGSQRSICMAGVPVFDRHGRFRGYRGVARDVSDRQELEGRIAHLASHDALTGLVNRQEFLQRLQRIVDTAATGDSEHGLCYVDVDRFRAINDRCGHPAGDQLLIALADLLRDQIRRRDTLARVGGNAFAILMEHCSIAQIERVAENVRRAVGEFRFERLDAIINFTVTIGVVPIDSNSRSVDRVLRSADRACYAAKSAGGDRILIHGRPDQRAARERRRNISETTS